MNTDSNAFSDVDDQIFSCLNIDEPKSFFLFAGAGSGKTRSLVEVLKRFKEKNVQQMKLNGQKVAIITYTNAASDEIKRRLEFDSNFIVSTIHSFAWELIKPYSQDIKDWIRKHTQDEIDKLQDQQRRGRAGTKAESDRAAKIISKTKRLETLDSVKKYSYNPNGINKGKDSLNHAEVIKIASDFLMYKTLMQQILIKKYPILLIDESQDTKKELIEAFFLIQSVNSEKFSLGLFGDTMQRIYTDGKPDLGTDIPESWKKPAKLVNYRCSKRVITLINKIRSDVDEHSQIPYDKNEDGVVRLFIVPIISNIDKEAIEKEIAEQMATITSDQAWINLRSEVKTLTLEHHMAAKRSGFIDFFQPLYNASSDSTGLLDGSMQGIPFLIHQLLPLFKAKQAGDEFAIAQIIKEHSPLLDKKILKESNNPIEQLSKTNTAVELFFSLWNEEADPSLLAVLKKIKKLNLLSLPEHLAMIIERSDVVFEESDSEEDKVKTIDAWEDALKSSFTQLEKYADYISENSPFGTHQGIKGLEFPRVIVILDDEEARGFLFSYEKLFGAKAPTATDIKNEAEGKETGIDRTRRLFYVTCSRAEKSLAIIAYTKDPDATKKHAVSQGWFSEDEVVTK